MKRILFASVLVLGLAACGTDEPEENQLDEEVEVEEEVEEEVDLSLYDEVIERYAEYTEEEEFVEEYEGTNGMLHMYHESHIEGFYSTYYDIDENGVEELLIALRTIDGEYGIIDIRTIADGEVIELLNEENGLHQLGERSGIEILENGQIYFSSITGDSGYLAIFDFNEEGTKLTETRGSVSDEEEYEEIDDEITEIGVVDVEDFDWEPVGEIKEISAYDEFKNGHYDRLEGTWENEAGDMRVEIEEDELKYEDGTTFEYSLSSTDESEEDYVNFGVMEPSGIGGFVLTYFPEEVELDLGVGVVESDTSKSRIIMGQDMYSSTENIFYKVNE